MNVLSVERLAKRYGPRQLFTDISFGLEKGQKTAIVARNGTGKSTLLKCIAGIETPDEGKVTFNKGLRIGTAHQVGPGGERRHINDRRTALPMRGGKHQAAGGIEQLRSATRVGRVDVEQVMCGVGPSH